MSELLDAVDALTRPTRVRVVQPVYETKLEDGRPAVDDNGAPIRHVVATKVTKLDHDPLLQQLDDAIRGAMGGTEGQAATQKSTRGMINSEALYQFARIRSQITDWARMAGVPRTDDPLQELRRWYITWTATEQTDAATRWHTRTLQAWAAVIRDVIDPWTLRTLEGPCPMPDCPQEQIGGLWFYWDHATRQQGNRPLVVEHRQAEPGERVEEWSRGRCRACGTVWGSVRALQWDREHAADERMTPM